MNSAFTMIVEGRPYGAAIKITCRNGMRCPGWDNLSGDAIHTYNNIPSEKTPGWLEQRVPEDQEIIKSSIIKAY
jgi:hypothetical protein